MEKPLISVKKQKPLNSGELKQWKAPEKTVLHLSMTEGAKGIVWWFEGGNFSPS